MVDQEKLGFLIPIIAYLIGSFLIMVVMYELNIIYVQMGWVPDVLFQTLNTIIIILGFVVPYVIIGLNVVGIFTTGKSENFRKMIGITDIVVGFILMSLEIGFLLFAHFWVTYDLGALATLIALPIAIINTLLTIAAVLMIPIFIGGLMIFRNKYAFWS